MPAEPLSCFRGSDLIATVTLLDDYGTAVPYDELDTLSGSVWPGGDLAAVAALAVAAGTPASGTVVISLTAADTADIDPGVYPVMVTVEDDDEILSSFVVAHLTVKAAPGTADPPPTYCSLQDMVDECPWIQDLLPREGELAGFLRARALARKDVDGTIVARYPGESAWIREQLADDALVVDEDVRRAVALLALGHVMEHQTGSRDKTSFQMLGRDYRQDGLNLLKGLQVGLITGSGTVPDLLVDMGVIPLRRG